MIGTSDQSRWLPEACKIHALDLEGVWMYSVTVPNASLVITTVTKRDLKFGCRLCTSETIQTRPRLRTHDSRCMLASLLTPALWRQQVKALSRLHALAHSADTVSDVITELC